MYLLQSQINKRFFRDLKCDNILLCLQEGAESPHLVLSDFGCCLSDSSFKVGFFSHEADPRVGNAALMPPEVRESNSGQNTYSMVSYIWNNFLHQIYSKHITFWFSEMQILCTKLSPAMQIGVLKTTITCFFFWRNPTNFICTSLCLCTLGLNDGSHTT